MTEQRALDEVRRNRRQVDGDEGTVGLRGVVVDPASDESPCRYPLSPSTSTVAGTRATFAAADIVSRMAALGPTTTSRSPCSSTWADSASTRRLRSCFSAALRTTDRSES